MRGGHVSKWANRHWHTLLPNHLTTRIVGGETWIRQSPNRALAAQTVAIVTARRGAGAPIGKIRLIRQPVIRGHASTSSFCQLSTMCFFGWQAINTKPGCSAYQGHVAKSRHRLYRIGFRWRKQVLETLALKPLPMILDARLPYHQCS